MESQIEETGALSRVLRFSVPSSEIDGAVAKKLRELSGQVRLNGFRPGKVPVSVLQQRFGKQVREEIQGDLINEQLSKALEEAKLRPVDINKLDRDGGEQGKDLAITAEFDIFPDLDLAPLDQLAIERTVADVTDADVEKALEQLAEQHAEYHDVVREAADGDRAIIDFVGRMDGEVFEGGTGNDTPVDIGAGRFLPDFEAALPGMKAGEEKTFPVTFPEDYQAEQLAGKQVEFTATVKQVQERELPTLDDAFAEKVGVAEGGVAALRTQLTEHLKNQAAQQLAPELRAQVMDKAWEAYSGTELPPSLVERERHQLEHAEHDHEHGQECNHGELDPEKAAELDSQARRRVGLGLLVAEVARQREIEADDQQVNQRLIQMVSQHPQGYEMYQQYQQNPQMMNQLRSMILEEQVVDSLVESGQVTDTHKPFAEIAS